jgi:hypothetical protein
MCGSLQACSQHALGCTWHVTKSETYDLLYSHAQDAQTLHRIAGTMRTTPYAVHKLSGKMMSTGELDYAI